MNEKDDENESLDDILDGALKDFQNDDYEKLRANVTNEKDDMWNEEFYTEETKLLHERISAIFTANDTAPTVDQIASGFQKMAEATSVALQSKLSVDDMSTKYGESIAEALKGLKEGIDNLQVPISEADMANMFSGINLQEGEANNSNPFLPFMHGMMQSLLSAEILLPSIKELLNKYPRYLEEKSNEISISDKERYLKQQELFRIICNDLEGEKAEDSSEIKQERFKRVLNNMQKLHEYGQPPEDLIGDIGVEIPSFGSGIQESQQQCPLM